MRTGKKIYFGSAIVAAYMLAPSTVTNTVAQTPAKPSAANTERMVVGDIMRDGQRIAKLLVQCRQGNERIEIHYERNKNYICSSVGTNASKAWTMMMTLNNVQDTCPAPQLVDADLVIGALCKAGRPDDNEISSFSSRLEYMILK